MKNNIVDQIIAFEMGELNDQETLELFSKLIADGSAWTMQGYYGRTASLLIQSGYVDQKGNILIEL